MKKKLSRRSASWVFAFTSNAAREILTVGKSKSGCVQKNDQIILFSRVILNVHKVWLFN